MTDAQIIDKAYVFNGTEVVLTGKIAKKNLRSGKEDILYEIKPRLRENGTWTKWVHLKDLFEIISEPPAPAPLRLVKEETTKKEKQE